MPGGPGGRQLAVAVQRGDVQVAHPGLGRRPLAVHVLQVRPGLGQLLQLGRDPARLVLDLGVEDVDPLHLEAHGSVLLDGRRGRAMTWTVQRRHPTPGRGRFATG